VPSPAASSTIDTTIVDFLTSRAKLLHTDKVRYMFFCRGGIRLVLCGIKIIKYIQHIVRVSWQNILQRPHEAEGACRSLLFTRMAVPHATVVIHTIQ